jgi:DNA-binding transcriptional regulator PaaX
MKVHFELALEMFFYGLAVFSRSDCGLILAGCYDIPSGRRVDELLTRMQQNRLITRHGRGKKASFAITDLGRQRVRIHDPTLNWNQSWDRKWRVFTFDLPIARRNERLILWRALRDAKLGLLQRSVWVWPRDVQPLLEQITTSRSIPECFCGFEAGKVFLCDSTEIVTTAWDFEEIGRRHATYLRHAIATPAGLNRCRSLRELSHLARIERDAFAFAFSLDPLLPRELWPDGYRGLAVYECRRAFQSVLRRRLRELCDG